MKNLRLKDLRIFLFALSILLMQSCMKNNYLPPSAMELPLAAQYSNKPYQLTATGDSVTARISINVASAASPTTINTATLGTEPEWINWYNAQQTARATKAQQDYLAANALHKDNDSDFPYPWTPMELLPDSLYTVSSYDLAVPASERMAYADVVVKTSKFEHGHNYVLPLTIKKSSLIISSWRHLPLWFISSTFGGKYNNFHGTLVGGAYNEHYDDALTLTTIDQHTVADTLTVGDFFGGYTQYHFNANGSVSVRAGNSSSSLDDYGAVVEESSSNAATGEFYVKFSVFKGAYTFTVNFNR